MPQLFLTIDTPHMNDQVSDTLFVSGSLAVDGQGKTVTNLKVQVSFGQGGDFLLATGTTGWHCTGKISKTAIGGQPLTISVHASGTFLIVPGEPDTVATDSSVVVIVAQTPPTLTVDVSTDVTTPPNVPYSLSFSGTAHDETAIASVLYSLDGSAFAPVNNLTGDWASWSKSGLSLSAGEHHLTVQASDTHQNLTSQLFVISVKEPFQPPAVDQAFATTTYLQELLDFANRQIKIGTTSTGPTATTLAARFFQPFDKLITSAAFEQAVLPVHPARIAIEVLRRKLTPAAPSDIDQRFRSSAYQSLVRELGASHEELRLARVADDRTRQALAARLGIEIASPRPDHLDQITFLPDTITDAQLEAQFGYRSTTAADPLQPPSAAAAFLGWRLAALRNVWLKDDKDTRDVTGAPLPIIDPDLIAQSNISAQTSASPAFNLWTTRKAWINTTLSNIVQEAGTQTTLAQYDHIVLKFVGQIDLAALATRDANGEDITADLAAFHLDLDGFRFLASCRALLAAGTLLQSEWQDIFAILLQVQKRLQFGQWRTQELSAGVILEPSQFLPTAPGSSQAIPAWRGSSQTLSQWRRALLARIAQKQTVENAYNAAVDAAEDQTLPGLRDALIQVLGQRQPTPEDLDTAAERLTRELLIDLRANAGPRLTRVDQALETLQGVLFSVRSGRLATGSDGQWTLKQEQTFDVEWDWMGSYRTWVAAMRVFAYPENQLFPSLYVPDGQLLQPTQAFLSLIVALRRAFKVTPEDARQKASTYLNQLRQEIGAALPAQLASSAFFITEQMSDAELIQRQQLVASLFGSNTDPNNIPQALREVFLLVPMAIGFRLQQERHYLTALDWFQTVYAFNLPPANRKIYRGLTLEESVTSAYVRIPDWLIDQINPHVVARTSRAASGALLGRKNVYTRFTVMSIVRCFLDYADLEFSRNLAESIARARGLYETAADLLNLPDVRPETGSTIPFPANPVWDSLRMHAESNLAKIRNGMNIAGVRSEAPPAGSTTIFLPSQYRYSALVERAKNLVSIAQQVESAFLSALEQRDSADYTVLQANHDIEVARSSITLADLKLADANINEQVAGLQLDRAQVQFGHYDQLIKGGLNNWETATLVAMGEAVAFRAVSAFSSFGLPVVSQTSSLAELASSVGQFSQTQASFERRQEDWQLQKQLSSKDVQIGQQQILHAQNQTQVALQERQLSGLQFDHAVAVLDYLASKFTNAELFDWMSGVLGHVYAYFLQQATSMALLAQAQLAFERQEPALGFVASDYWQDNSDVANGAGSTTPVDRQGLTGSTRLLQDISRLDQYAFDTDRRKLHLSQTFSIAQIAALEMQKFRETGLLVFATPTEMFDQEFPGHYLRTIKRVLVSLNALVSPVRGVRATLSASGLSRVVVAGDQFVPVVLSRPPEAIAFTSPQNATGLFNMEPENGLLLPFEGMGVDTVWELELPKPANPFDYQTIVDVLLTIEYTAANSYDYRQAVLRGQDRQFNADRAFSVRDEFPDAWYDLNNPETVTDETNRMRAFLPIRRENFPPHLDDLAVREISLFCLREDGFTQELRITRLSYAPSGGPTINTAEVRTTGGIIGTRRPNGAALQVVVGKDPVGEWSIQFENTKLVQGWFKEGLVQDVVLVMTVSGVTPAWL
jgi:hypothetical protein